MEALIGIALAVSVGLLLSWSRMDRDRAVYPIAMIVIGSYYLLFALIGQSPASLLVELAVFAVFAAAAIAGFRSSLWLVVAALATHGVFDLFHGLLVNNPGVPTWWPGFCAAYDVIAAAYLAVLLRRGRIAARGSSTALG